DGVNWTWFATAAAGGTSYSWFGASPSTTYSFRATAYNAAGESAPTNVASVTTPSTVPAAPGNLTATAAASGRQIDLTWADNSTNESGFNVYLSTDGLTYSVLTTAAANATGFSWTGASPGASYSFRVTAFNANGESAPSNAASVTTPGAPAAPSGLAAMAAANGRQVNLSWADNSANENGFNVYQSGDGVNFAVIASVGPGVTAYSWTAAPPDRS